MGEGRREEGDRKGGREKGRRAVGNEEERREVQVRGYISFLFLYI